jgi:hypothetical protein
MPKRNRTSRPTRLQVSVRTVLILLLALAAALVTTILLWATAVPIVLAVLGGIAASAKALQFLDKIIERDSSRC